MSDRWHEMTQAPNHAGRAATKSRRQPLPHDPIFSFCRRPSHRGSAPKIAVPSKVGAANGVLLPGALKHFFDLCSLPAILALVPGSSFCRHKTQGESQTSLRASPATSTLSPHCCRGCRLGCRVCSVVHGCAPTPFWKTVSGLSLAKPAMHFLLPIPIARQKPLAERSLPARPSLVEHRTRTASWPGGESGSLPGQSHVTLGQICFVF